MILSQAFQNHYKRVLIWKEQSLHKYPCPEINEGSLNRVRNHI